VIVKKEEDAMRALSTLLLVTIPMVFGTPVRAQEVDWQKVDDAFARKAALVAGDVHRYDFPRTDLSVTLDGVALKPALALIGWVTLKPMHGEVMAMGDLVLLDSEINPVMTKMIENGIEITALHNHLLRTTPALFFMHVGGHGDPARMASAIHAALAASKTPLAPPAAAPPTGDRPRHNAARPDHRRQRPSRWWRLRVRCATPRPNHRRRHARKPAWAVCRRNRNRLSADRRRQGRDHWRLRDDG
jgi:hypothetical protein